MFKFCSVNVEFDKSKPESITATTTSSFSVLLSIFVCVSFNPIVCIPQDSISVPAISNFMLNGLTVSWILAFLSISMF